MSYEEATRNRVTRAPRFLSLVVVLVFCTLHADVAGAASIKTLCEIQGVRGNALLGLGLVVGLAGTGDSAKIAVTAQERLLEQLGFDVRDIGELSSKNSAVVAVSATIPAFAKEGILIDVSISSWGDAKSLEGGTLLLTHLKFPGDDETIYALAQGPISVGGFNADAGSASVRQNHVAAGRIPRGAYIEREVPSTVTDGERIQLLLKNPDFGTAQAVKDALDARFGMDAALALGAGAVLVTIPEQHRADLVGFIAQVQDVTVLTQTPTKVVINERTGTIVVGGNVIIKPCHVAHGNLTIEIAKTPSVAQALPFTDAQPVVTETTSLTVIEPKVFLMPVEGTSAGEVAEALNRLRISPRDMISIFQALRAAGALEADLESM